MNEREAMKVIRSGWISKKVAHAFPHGLYRQRYLVLDERRLSYFHSNPNDTPSSPKMDPEFALPLSEATEVVLLKCDDPTLGYFEVITQSRRYRFKTTCDEAELWVRDINRTKISPSGINKRPLLYLETAKTAVPKTNSTLGGLMKSFTGLISSQSAPSGDDNLFSIDQVHSIQRCGQFE
jgi:hypothetical protein